MERDPVNDIIRLELKGEKDDVTVFVRQGSSGGSLHRKHIGSALAGRFRLASRDGETGTASLPNVVTMMIRGEERDLVGRLDPPLLRGLGEHLFENTLRPCWQAILNQPTRRLRIATQDSFLRKIPWPLLRPPNNPTLVETEWTIALESPHGTTKLEVRRPRRILAVMPRATGEPTGWKDHKDELEKLARPVVDVEIVRTWEGLKIALQNDGAEILYFFGHGKVDPSNELAHLLFDPEDGRPDPIDFHDICKAMRTLPPKNRPQIAYFNGCFSSYARRCISGSELEQTIPAVITNRSRANTDWARQQALTFLDQVLRGSDPEEAMGHAYRRGDGRCRDSAKIFGPTPELTVAYSAWLPNSEPSPLRGDWKSTLDREKAFAYFAQRTRRMVDRKQKGPLCLAWIGAQNQGVHQFTERVKKRLGKDLGFRVSHFDLAWPTRFDSVGFETLLSNAVGPHARSQHRAKGATALDLLDGRMQGRENARHLILLLHPGLPEIAPRPGRHGRNPVKQLESYHEWLKNRLTRGPRSGKTFIVVGLPIELPPKQDCPPWLTDIDCERELSKCWISQKLADLEPRDITEALMSVGPDLCEDEQSRLSDAIRRKGASFEAACEVIGRHFNA